MLLASYKSTRPGLQGLANVLIRLRLGGIYSHCELVFQPGDGVDHLMPDGTTAPDDNGALWCVSSVAAERLPAHSPRRAGRVGGVRFKRITLDPARWHYIPVQRNALLAAAVARRLEGAPYDWQLIAGYVAWLIPHKASRFTCSELVAACLAHPDPHRFDPCVLHAAHASLVNSLPFPEVPAELHATYLPTL